MCLTTRGWQVGKSSCHVKYGYSGALDLQIPVKGHVIFCVGFCLAALNCRKDKTFCSATHFRSCSLWHCYATCSAPKTLFPTNREHPYNWVVPWAPSPCTEASVPSAVHCAVEAVLMIPKTGPPISYGWIASIKRKTGNSVDPKVACTFETSVHPFLTNQSELISSL